MFELDVSAFVCKGTYLGVSIGLIKLACNSRHWTIGNWTFDELYSTQGTTCALAQLDFTPTVIHGKRKA